MAEPLGRAAVAGSCEAGCPVASSSLPAFITATATAAPTATVASTPPPTNSSRRRLVRASEASASAAQSGVPPSLPLFHDCWECGFQGSHWDCEPPCP